ncbi:unnamed protein product [Lupinus luteus]|uniref:Uncharacterized protein n=1 Tax=Lupinus luteus TaxID=3873 RepID=A0AAV1WH11_LUPLU
MHLGNSTDFIVPNTLTWKSLGGYIGGSPRLGILWRVSRPHANKYLRSKNLPCYRVAPDKRRNEAFSVKLRDDRSYAEEVRGCGGGEVMASALHCDMKPSTRKEVRALLLLSALDSDLGWLGRYLVGRIVESVTLASVQGLLKEGGTLTVTARPLGGKSVLLAPMDGECVKEVLSDASIWSSNTFISLVPWSVDCVEAERLV